MIATSQQLGLKLLEALGINTPRVKKIVFSVLVGEVATVEVTSIIEVDTAEKVADVVKSYKLVERE